MTNVTEHELELLKDHTKGEDDWVAIHTTELRRIIKDIERLRSEEGWSEYE